MPSKLELANDALRRYLNAFAKENGSFDTAVAQKAEEEFKEQFSYTIGIQLTSAIQTFMNNKPKKLDLDKITLKDLIELIKRRSSSNILNKFMFAAGLTILLSGITLLILNPIGVLLSILVILIGGAITMGSAKRLLDANLAEFNCNVVFQDIDKEMKALTNAPKVAPGYTPTPPAQHSSPMVTATAEGTHTSTTPGPAAKK